MLKRLHKGNEERRCWNIIDVFRSRDARYVPQLLALLRGRETYDNKRHIIRALGNIGDTRAERALLSLLDTSRGLMLGDVVHSLGQLRSQAALGRIAALREHDLRWVRQNANWALAGMSGRRKHSPQ
jgi:HEAT repeat protein